MKFCEEFKRLKGQPIEIVTVSGMKFCGIDVDFDDDSVTLLDKKGRTVIIYRSHIDAVIEPQMKLDVICGDDDCDCRDRDNDRDCRNNDRDCRNNDRDCRNNDRDCRNNDRDGDNDRD